MAAPAQSTPRTAEALFSLGNQCRARGDLAGAADAYEQAVALFPNEAGAYSGLGTHLAEMGFSDRAARAFERAAALSRSSAEVAFHCGCALAARCDHAAAVASFEKAIRAAPGHARAHLHRGFSRAAMGEKQAAAESFEQAARLAPDDAVALNNLGATLLDLGQAERAIAPLERATALAPGHAEGHLNLGNARMASGHPAEAIGCFERALHLRPRYAKAWLNRGTCAEQLGNLPLAASSYEQALAAQTEYPEALANLGQVLAAQGDPRGLALLEQAVERDPESADAHWDLGVALLLHGRYARGWREYEWRWRWPGCSPMRPFSQPLWDGRELDGATILLHAEQGLGDTLQFARYAPLVAARGGRVVLEVQAALTRLLMGVPGVEQVVGHGDPLPDFSCHAPLMSLPGIFGTTLLSVPPPLSLSLISGAGREREFRAGLVWSGNPAHARDRIRSLPLRAFSPLLEVEGVEFVSLQKGPAAVQNREGRLGRVLAEPCAEARDLADTAAVIAGLDLVITVDTAVAHLAGCLGKPVWILLATLRDWRWGLDGETTPWYPTARLLRQRRPGEWGEVMVAMASRLASISRRRAT